jgi:hypothetical protein
MTLCYCLSPYVAEALCSLKSGIAVSGWPWSWCCAADAANFTIRVVAKADSEIGSVGVVWRIGVARPWPRLATKDRVA